MRGNVADDAYGRPPRYSRCRRRLGAYEQADVIFTCGIGVDPGNWIGPQRTATVRLRMAAAEVRFVLPCRYGRRRRMEAMGDITELLHAARAGDSQALDAVFANVYPSLRALAASRLAGQSDENTLSATALVHEAYLKLVDARQLDLADRHHFFACAARAMRQILVDHARARGAVKRGGPLAPLTLSRAEGLAAPEPELLDIDAALDRLDEIARDLRQLVEMRLFAGLTLEQLAETTGRSLRTINRDWQRARALLLAQLA